MKERESELRSLIRESHLRPVRIHFDDRKTHPIKHPDFAIVAEGALPLVSGPGIDLGEARFAVCNFEHIVRVEGLGKQSKAAA